MTDKPTADEMRLREIIQAADRSFVGYAGQGLTREMFNYVIDQLTAALARAEAAESALPAARAEGWAAGREAAAQWHEGQAYNWTHGPHPGTIMEGERMASFHNKYAEAIRALQPAAVREGEDGRK